MRGGPFGVLASSSLTAVGREAIKRDISSEARPRPTGDVSPIRAEARLAFNRAAFTARVKVVTTIAPDGAAFLAHPTGCPRRTNTEVAA